MNNLILLIIFGYLLGSIPVGFLISKSKGVDIRKIGSGAIGGTNVSRALGSKWGIFVGILDLLKGVIPVYLAMKFLSLDWQIAAVALSPVLGHIFPVWLGFRGGKGVSTTIGVIFVLLGWKMTLLWLLVFVVILLIVRVMSFASLVMSSLLPLFFLMSSFSCAYFILGWALFSLIWWAHRENLQRMRGGREPKFTFKKTIS